jgi:OOP family OmpA-OmpF porin
MKMRSILAVITLGASAFALPAAAQMNMSSFYVGATFGQSDFGSCEAPAGVSCDTKDTAWRALAGYQFNRNFAAEIGYHNLGEVKFSGAGLDATTKVNAWELVGVGLLPFANQFAGYAKLGGYHAKTELSGNLGSADDTNTGLTYGVGLQWDPMPPLGVRVEWQRYNDVGGDNSAKGDISVLSLGAIWRFR